MIYVKDVMSRNVRTVEADSSMKAAAKAMARWKIGSLVIVEGNSPVGIITEGDISRIVARGSNPGSTSVSAGRKKLMSVSPGERIEVAAMIMADNGIKKLPVLEARKLIGIITQTDIVNSSFALITSLKEMVKARYRPPDFEM